MTPGFEIFHDETEDFFGVIERVAADGFHVQRECFFGFLEHGDGLMDFTDIGGMSDFQRGNSS